MAVVTKDLGLYDHLNYDQELEKNSFPVVYVLDVMVVLTNFLITVTVIAQQPVVVQNYALFIVFKFVSPKHR